MMSELKYNPGEGCEVPAGEVRKGMELRSPDGRWLKVVDVSVSRRHDEDRVKILVDDGEEDPAVWHDDTPEHPYFVRLSKVESEGEEFDELKWLAEQRTSGEWSFVNSSDSSGRKGEFRSSTIGGFTLAGTFTRLADMELMAKAPELLEEVLRLRGASPLEHVEDSPKPPNAFAVVAELEHRIDELLAIIEPCPRCKRRKDLKPSDLELFDNGLESLKEEAKQKVVCGNCKFWMTHNGERDCPECIVGIMSPEAEPPCTGCNSPASKCGPQLWRQQKKCCPDCSHTAAWYEAFTEEPEAGKWHWLENQKAWQPCFDNGCLQKHFDRTEFVAEEPEGEDREPDDLDKFIAEQMKNPEFVQAMQEAEERDRQRVADSQPHKTLREKRLEVFMRGGEWQEQLDALDRIDRENFWTKRKEIMALIQRDVCPHDEPQHPDRDKCLAALLFGDNQ